jgi:TetR/AcrR family transcriptional regulator
MKASGVPKQPAREKPAVKRASRDGPLATRARKASRRRSPGRPGRSELSVGADTIVLKACELLRHVAPRELSLIGLARHARIDRSLIRYYFTDRSSVLLAAARHLFGLLRTRLAVVESRYADDAESRIREMAVTLLSFQIEHPYFHRLMIDEVVNSSKREAQEFFRSFTTAAVEDFRRMSVMTARRGVSRAFEGVFLYLAIIGMCEFFVTGRPILEVAFGRDFDPGEVSRHYEAFLRSYVVDGIRRR